MPTARHGALAVLLIAGFLGRPVVAEEAASGSPPIPERLTPETAVAIAIEHHPVLAAAESEVDAAAAESDFAKTGWLPRIDAVLDATRSTNPTFVFASKLGQETFGPADFAIDALNQPDALTNVAKRIVVQQNIWDASRTSLGKEATALGVEAASARRERTREEVAFGALRAFWGAVLAEEMQEVASAAEKAAYANVDLARALVEEGAAVPSDRMQAEVRLAEVRTLVVRAEEGVEVSRAALRQALGISEDRAFALDPPSVETGGEARDAQARLDEARSTRPDLLALDAQARQAEVGERMARSRRLPVIGLGAQAEWNGDGFLTNTGNNWSVGAMLTLPVFEGNETRAKSARAAADRARVEAYRRALDEGIRLEVRAALAQRASAAERLRTAESAAGLAAEALRIVRERYAEGMAVMVELLGAEAAETAARGNRAHAAHDLALARAAVDLASGRSLVSSTESTQ
jgi:outer membrane protein TolC